MTIHAYAAHEAAGPLRPFAYEPALLGPYRVVLAA
jgi:hypothetical protein